MRTVLFAFLLGFALPVLATSVSIGNKVISTGDAAGKVIELAGHPDRTEQRVDGEQWEYYRKKKTYILLIREGKVVEIKEVRH